MEPGTFERGLGKTLGGRCKIALGLCWSGISRGGCGAAFFKSSVREEGNTEQQGGLQPCGSFVKSGFQHCSLLQEVGILLARGLFVGLVRLKPARARTSTDEAGQPEAWVVSPVSGNPPGNFFRDRLVVFRSEPPRFLRTSRAKMASSLQCPVELLLWSGICSGRSTYRKSA